MKYAITIKFIIIIVIVINSIIIIVNWAQHGKSGRPCLILSD